MVAQPIPVPRFQAEHEEPVRVLPLTEVRPAAGRVSVRTRPGGDEALATVPEETTSDLPVRFLLAMEDGGERVSLSLRMHVTQGDPPTPYYLETPGTVRGLRLAMRFSESGQGDLQLETDYTGLDAAKAYSYARFVAALKRREGIFRVLAYAGNILRHVATIQLPLPFDESDSSGFALLGGRTRGGQGDGNQARLPTRDNRRRFEEPQLRIRGDPQRLDRRGGK
jgi:hypothetical protein